MTGCASLAVPMSSDDSRRGRGDHSHTINEAGSHNHTSTMGNTGSGQSHENRPPYYALAFIMRIA